MIERIRDPAVAMSTLRLWQLISPALPIGAYAYSDGLESAVAAGWVDDEHSAGEWIVELADYVLVGLDIPAVARLHRAWSAGDAVAARRWSAFLLAARESAEMQDGDRHLGQNLARLLVDLGIPRAAPWRACEHASLAALFTLAAHSWAVPLPEAASAYAWLWIESRVAAAVKLVPLGQTAGQRILFDAAARIPPQIERGLGVTDERMGAGAPGLAIASARHEHQYSRLFRS